MVNLNYQAVVALLDVAATLRRRGRPSDLALSAFFFELARLKWGRVFSVADRDWPLCGRSSRVLR